ncbi:unnamed protein product [Taenia asiatica]|uniref:Leucine-rich repeat domain, L domain-containing protein n=1 Tax=Taenia asiatica TaxID=60517 RepID=A0A0R3W125_TAEAS|nr:unnamed protein product [Taenia asiatica]
MLFITECQVDLLPSFENLSNLTYLDLSFSSLSYFPDDIGSLRMLKVLKLSGNRVTNIPSGIVYLELLQVLDLSQNMISHLPRELCTLRSLIYFDCSFNTLFRLPDNISELLYLEVLFLSGNVLTTLPTNFSLLKRLQRLNLSSNRFEYIPFCIFQCSSLKEFLFSYNQASGFIPDNLCRLSDLEILSLAFNKFTKLPGKLSNLSNLRFLDIKGNNIGRIPDEIFSRCKNLTFVNCGSCELNEIPSSLGLCTNMRVLDLSSNMLKNLPSDGKALKNLISLFLKDNKITVLPHWICELENVIAISVCKNLLQDLPSDFSRVAERLRMINISCNEFEVIPSCLFSKNSKLIYFLLDHNPVLQLPPEICNLKFLTHLSISHCPYIFELPDELGGLLKLRSLRLCSNSLLKLPRTMQCLKALNYLDLSDNKFSHFPVVVCYIPHLKVLLYNNCCHVCTYSESDPPGWFDRTDLIDPNASMEKLGKVYIDEIESLASEDEGPPSLEEALELEEKALQIPIVKHGEISNLVFKRKPHRIPKFIYCLKFLVHLSLQNNGLYFLPNVFDRFKYLKRIYLNDNNLRKIPESIVACKTLTDIDLRNNKLTEIHGELHRLPNLKRLELDGNNFSPCLSEVIKHSDLKGLCEYLDASNQKMRKLSITCPVISVCVYNGRGGRRRRHKDTKKAYLFFKKYATKCSSSVPSMLLPISID